MKAVGFVRTIFIGVQLPLFDEFFVCLEGQINYVAVFPVLESFDMDYCAVADLLGLAFEK